MVNINRTSPFWLQRDAMGVISQRQFSLKTNSGILQQSPLRLIYINGNDLTSSVKQKACHVSNYVNKGYQKENVMDTKCNMFSEGLFVLYRFSVTH